MIIMVKQVDRGHLLEEEEIEAGISAVHTAATVATGEVNCYNFIVQLCSLPWFVEAMSCLSAVH